MLLAIAGWKFTYGLENYVDINFHDPSFYLLNGVTLHENGLPDAENGPFYAVWFYLLSLTQPDRIELFYRDYKLLTILLPLMIYLVLRRCSVSSIAALVGSALSLVSFFNFPSFTRVSHFAVCIILASLVGASFARRFQTATAIAALGALFASYVRPELFLAWMMLSILCVATFLYGYWREVRGRDLIPLGLFVLVNAAVLYFLGIPVAGGRGVVAFAEHFAINWAGWTGSSLDPWTNAREIFSGSFGDAKSVSAALLANPGAVLKHVMTNWQRLPGNMVYLFSVHTWPVITGSLALGTLCLLVVIRCFEKGFCWKQGFRDNGRMLLYCLVYLVGMMVTVTVIYPRLHYLVLGCVLLIIVVSSIFLSRGAEEKALDGSRAVLAGLMVIAFVPAQNITAVRANAETVRLIQSLRIEREVYVLCEGGVPQLYLGSNYHRYSPAWEKGSFNRFLLDRKMNMVIVTENLRTGSWLAEDVEWKRFLDRYSKKGFVKYDVPGTDRAVMVHQSLIDRGGAKGQ